MGLREDADRIIDGSIRRVLPDEAVGIDGLKDTAVFSVGSDGTDGPTDAAGGYVDGMTKAVLSEKGIDIYKTLHDNNAYPVLQACNGLIFTGPTGTNVNDVAVVLIRRRQDGPEER